LWSSLLLLLLLLLHFSSSAWDSVNTRSVAVLHVELRLFCLLFTMAHGHHHHHGTWCVVYSTCGHRRCFEQETRSLYRQHAYKLTSLLSGQGKGCHVISQTLLMFEFRDGWLCWDVSNRKRRISMIVFVSGPYNQSLLRRASQRHFRGQQVKVLADDEKAQLHTTNSTSTTELG
jgi:hypothetical protein